MGIKKKLSLSLMQGKKLKLILITCFFNILMTAPIPSNIHRILRKLRNLNDSSPNILIMVNQFSGEFNPVYEFGVELHNQGAKLDFGIRDFELPKDRLEEKMKEINADYKFIHITESMSKEQEKLTKWAVAEMLLWKKK